jgi:hypothetical protein
MESTLVEPSQRHAKSFEAGNGAEQEIHRLLATLPDDVRRELNLGSISVRDPAFLDGLTDHLAHLAIADPRQGKRLLGKLEHLKKRLRREIRESEPAAATSETVTRPSARVGRNAPCPCGSGRKFKQCCLRMG